MTPQNPEDQLDRLFDDLLQRLPLPADADSATVAVLQRLQRAAHEPAPDPDFVHHLGASFREPQAVDQPVSLPPHRAEVRTAPAQPPPFVMPRPNRALWSALAAAAIVLALLGGYLALVSPWNRPPTQLGATLEHDAAIPVRLRISAANLDTGIVARTPGALAPQGTVWNAGWRADTVYVMDKENTQDRLNWLLGSASPGENGNVVLQWGGNPAATSGAQVYGLHTLTAGDRIEVTTDDNTIMAYRVDWVRTMPAVADAPSQRTILGPTAQEALTLIAGQGAFSAQDGQSPEVLVVRADFAGATPPWSISKPDAALCQAAPRTLADMERIAAEVTGPPQAAPAALTAGAQAVSPANLQRVVATEETLVACLNANDSLRVYGLYSDHGLAQVLRFAAGYVLATPGMEWAPDFSELATPSPSRPDGSQLSLLAIEDVRTLSDGRIAARVTISAGEDGSMLGVPSGFPVTHIFAPADGMRIDDFATV